jgi:hypothetical protein
MIEEMRRGGDGQVVCQTGISIPGNDAGCHVRACCICY